MTRNPAEKNTKFQVNSYISAKRSAQSSAEYIEDLSGNLIDFWAPLGKSAAAPTLSPV